MIAMRKIASVQPAVNGICSCMIHETHEGVFLYLFDSEQDGPCRFDYCFESVWLC